MSNNYNKCMHYNHYHDSHYGSSNEESCWSSHPLMPSNDEVSASGRSKAEHKNYHLSFSDHVPKKQRLTHVTSGSHKSSPSKSSQKALDYLLDWGGTFEDAYLANLDLNDPADLKHEVQVLRIHSCLAIDGLR